MCTKAMEAKMKKILILLFVFTVIPFAQDSKTEESAKSTIDELFSASKDKDYKGACALIVYTGSDTEKNYTVPLNPNSEGDLSKAERIAKKIKAYLDISDSYEISSVISQSEDGKRLVNVEVGFKSGKQVLEIDFKFVELDSKLLLVSID